MGILLEAGGRGFPKRCIFLSARDKTNMKVAFTLFSEIRTNAVYCAFHKHANSEVQKPTDDCIFRCRQSS